MYAKMIMNILNISMFSTPSNLTKIFLCIRTLLHRTLRDPEVHLLVGQCRGGWKVPLAYYLGFS